MFAAIPPPKTNSSRDSTPQMPLHGCRDSTPQMPRRSSMPDYGYEDMDAIRKLNEYMHCISSEHATLRRQRSSFGRLQQITGPTWANETSATHCHPYRPAPGRFEMEFEYSRHERQGTIPTTQSLPNERRIK
jgi:hypothetical protein